ncbi:MAG: hypothetical protein QM703_06110 [Gemmatales bacterium]
MHLRFLAVALAGSLLSTGCGPSKKVEKGSEEKIVLGTNQENKTNPNRPPVTVPTDVAGKTSSTPGKPK